MSDTSPLVSIIIPAFNAGQYLRECVMSVLAQTHHNLEAIIVDDGSTDSTSNIAESLAALDKRVKVIHRQNGGLSAARNTGIENAGGEYIGFVDADDAIHPRFIETALHEMGRTGADIFSCGIQRDDSSRWASAIPPAKAISPMKAIETVLYQRSGMLCSVCTHIYKASAIGPERFTPGLLYEDLDFFYRAFERATLIAHSEARMYFYRITPASLLHTFDARRLDVLDITDRISLRYRSVPDLAMAASDRRFAAHFNMFVLCTRHGMPHDAIRCWKAVEESRLKILFNHRSRLKNRIGALASLLGRRATLAIASLAYHTS